MVSIFLKIPEFIDDTENLAEVISLILNTVRIKSWILFTPDVQIIVRNQIGI